MNNTNLRLVRRAAALALIAALTTACGEASATQPNADASASVGVGPAVEARIVACLEEGGFAATPPPVDKDGAYLQRLEQCVTRLGVRDQFFDEPDAAQVQAEVERQNEATVAYIECLRNRGWRMPDPVRDDDGFLVDQEPIGVEGSQATAFDFDAQACNAEASAAIPDGAGHDHADDSHDHGDHSHDDEGH